MSDDSILATTFTTSNLSSASPSRGLKQSRTLKVIPFDGLADSAGDEEDEDDEEEEEEEEGIEEEEDGADDEIRNCLEADRSPSSLHSKASKSSSSASAFNTNLNRSLHHKSQSNLNNDSLASSSPPSTLASPNSQSYNDNRINNSRSPYNRLSSAMSSAYDTGLILTPPATVSSNLNNTISSPMMNDVLDQARGNHCCSIPISPLSSWPTSSSVPQNSSASATTTTTPTTPTNLAFANQPSSAPSASDQSIDMNQNQNHQLRRSLDSMHQHQHHNNHQQEQQASHDNLQKIQLNNGASSSVSQTTITPSSTLHHNQDSFSHHQLLNIDNIGHHLTSNNGSLPPFCTL